MQNIAVGIFNILFVLLAAPLLDGLMRQVRARIHSRQGPPILQTYYDLGHLMVKEDQRGVNNAIFSMAPIVALGAALLAALFIPMGGVIPLGFAGDAIVLMYVLTMGPVCLCLGGMASGSPYAYVGVNREIMMLTFTEPVMAITLFASAIKVHSLMLTDCIQQPVTGASVFSLVICGVAFFLALQPELARIPFDLSEAEQEIMEGPLIEYSGRKLALFKWSFYCKQIVLLTFFVEWFIPGPTFSSIPLRIVLTLVKVLICAVLVEVIAQIFPRMKIAQSMHYFIGVIVFALTGLMLAVIGH
jgi:formate hydrogenlyase subunit 4